MENVEIEYKVMLSKDEYGKVLNHFNDYEKKYIDQTNFYFETLNNDLGKHKLSLRIRYIKEKDEYIATLKESLRVGKLEHEYIIADNTLSSFPKEILSILSKYNININGLIMIGSLKTIRYEINYLNTLLCLDYNIYNNIEDYELECEASCMEKAKDVVSNLLNMLSIKMVESKYGKTVRFKNSLNN